MSEIKLFRTTLILLCAILLKGCLAERAYCPLFRNVTVRFVYIYNGGDVFSANVQMVNLFVFDNETGLLVHNEEVNYYKLNEFAGTMLSHLEPGEYHLVGWGNVLERNIFSGVDEGEHFTGAFVGRRGVPRSTEPQSGDGDRLHFAPGSLIIPRWSSDDIEITLPFTRAYIGLEVFVIDKFLYSGELESPVIEIDGAATHFDFERVPEGNITLRENTVVQTQFVERPAVAMFRVKLFDNISAIKQLRVHSGVDHEVHFSIDQTEFRQMITQFMVENGIFSLKSDPTPRRVIPILIRFTGQDVEVSIEVPNFEPVPGTPIY